MQNSSSRLRKSGLTRHAIAVAAVASTALMSAQASIVYSGLVNVTASSTSGSALANINVDNAGANEFTMRSFLGKGGVANTINNFGAGFQFMAADGTTFSVDKLAAGVSVGSVGIFSDASSNLGAGSIDNGFIGQGQWLGLSDGYFGFQFNPSGSQVDYGWAHITMSADDRTMTLVDYAYQTSGASILTGQVPPVPEPSTLALGALGLGMGTFLQRRRGTTKA